MNKKIIAITAVVMTFIFAVVGTLTYMTSTDQETNTFTAGGVKIDLIEQQRGKDEQGNAALVNFEQNKVLMPIVGSAQGEKDQFGMPVAENYVDKIVTIKNTGKSDAWIRAYYAVPSALDDGYETFNAGENILHGNFGNYKGEDGEWHTTYQNQWNWFHKNSEEKNVWNYFETTIDEVRYNVYFADYYIPVKAEETTAQFIMGVYLDKGVDMNTDGQYTITRTKDGVTTTKVIQNFPATIKYPVFAVAVQADGFENANAAINAAFGEHYNPWGGTAENWQ